MQAPFAFDSDGNLVISAKMVEALGLGKRRESQDMTQASPQDVIQAITAEIKKSDLDSGLQESLDAIRFDQISIETKARAEADSALAQRASALEASAGDLQAGLADEQQVRADADSALAADLAALSSRLDCEGANCRAELEALRDEVRAQDSNLESRLDEMDVRIEGLARKMPGK